MPDISLYSTKAKSLSGVEIPLYIDGDINQPTGFFFTVIGPSNPKAKEIAKAVADLHREADRKRQKIEPDDPRLIEIASDLIIGWREFEETVNGVLQPLPFTKANLLAVLDECPWMLTQAIGAFQDTKLFIGV